MFEHVLSLKKMKNAKLLWKKLRRDSQRLSKAVHIEFRFKKTNHLISSNRAVSITVHGFLKEN